MNCTQSRSWRWDDLPQLANIPQLAAFDSRRHSEIWMLSEECVGVKVNTTCRNSASLPNESRVSLD